MTGLAQRDDDFYNRIHLYAMQDLARGDFTLPVLAARMGMSVSTIKRRLASRGITFNDLRLELTGKLARQMLASTQMPVGDVALELGYSGPSAFNRAFRQMTGVTPRDYRRAHSGEAGG
jgi:AraC-like DNA-binding protein